MKNNNLQQKQQVQQTIDPKHQKHKNLPTPQQFRQELRRSNKYELYDFNLSKLSIRDITQISETPVVIRHNTVFYHPIEDKCHIIFIKNILPKTTRENVFKVLEKYYKIKKSSIHFGVWGQYQRFLHLISEGLTPTAIKLEEQLRKLSFFKEASELLEIIQVELSAYLEGALERKDIDKSYASYPAMAINKCFKDGEEKLDESRATEVHYDSLDSTLSLLFCFGQFVGGGLKFPQLNITLNFEPGDLVLFKGSKYLHGVEQFKGKRFSTVFFIHREIDYNNNRNYYPMKRGEASKQYKLDGSPVVYPTVYSGNFLRKKKSVGKKNTGIKRKKDEGNEENVKKSK